MFAIPKRARLHKQELSLAAQEFARFESLNSDANRMCADLATLMPHQDGKKFVIGQDITLPFWTEPVREALDGTVIDMAPVARVFNTICTAGMNGKLAAETFETALIALKQSSEQGADKVWRAYTVAPTPIREQIPTILEAHSTAGSCLRRLIKIAKSDDALAQQFTRQALCAFALHEVNGHALPQALSMAHERYPLKAFQKYTAA